MSNFKKLFLLSVISSVVMTGCMTPVTVMTDPPGATVYCRGAGRAAYKWQPRGVTESDKPVTFKVPYNAINTFVCWPEQNGQPEKRSEIRHTELLFTEDPVLNFKK